MGRPTRMVEVPVQLVHFGYIASWQDHDGYGSIWRSSLEAHKMGKRHCRWIEPNDFVCADLYLVTCPLCLKSKAALKERERPKIKRNLSTAEGRLFWKRLDESVKEHEKTVSPQQRFAGYCSMNPERIKKVISYEREYYPSGPWKLTLSQ